MTSVEDRLGTAVAAPIDLQCRSPLPETGWDYRTADTREYTHGIHAYPAMMIPQIARRLICEYGQDAQVLFDPYCGTGTALLEGMLAGLRSVGTDLNPLARLIASVKTTPVTLDVLDAEISRFAHTDLNAAPCERVEHIANVDYWFSPNVQRLLIAVRSYITTICEPAVADVFRVAFSQTVRKVSWTRDSEFKLHRIPASKIASHAPDVGVVMHSALNRVRDALGSIAGLASSPQPQICAFNSVNAIPAVVLAPGSVDLVVTSPPYGDSQTTVAYGQYSRLSSQWLGYEDAGSVDRRLMGGTPKDAMFGLDKLDSVIAEIATIDPVRARQVSGFFWDYRASIGNVAEAVRPGGYVCYVVANRTVKGLEIPTAQTTVEYFEALGFAHVVTHLRNIPNKRMPSRNSPTNIAGRTGRTMTVEHVVICRKDD